IIAYSDSSSCPKQAIDEIASMLQIQYTAANIEEENWNATWEEDFKPISIGNFCYIRADFHPPLTSFYQHEIIITPKMSFGTGHHETTQLVIQQMEQLDFNNKTVFDFGTGTGILAILAELLGADKILAIDNDKWSIENSMENINRNHCHNITVSGKDILEIDPAATAFDIILANINRQILTQYMLQLSSLLNTKGQIIISGFLEEDIKVLAPVIQNNNLVVL